MVVALQLVAVDDAEMQRHLAMRATVLEREDRAARTAPDDDRLTGEAAAERLPDLQLVGPRDRVPVVGMRADAPQVERLRGIGDADRDTGR